MNIILSQNEIRAEAKSLRGVGVDWGMAKDGGNRGLDGGT